MSPEELLERARAALAAVDLPGARTAADEARRIAPAGTPAHVEAAVLGARARLAEAAFPEGQALALQAVEAARALVPPDPLLAARADAVLGSALLDQGRLDRARPLLESAADVLQGHGRDGANALQQLTRLELAARRYAVAADLARRLERVAAKVDWPALERAARLLRAHALGQAGRHDEALALCEALLVEGAMSPQLHADVLREAAGAHVSLGRLSAAEALLTDAVALVSAPGLEHALGGVWAQLGGIRSAAGDLDGAQDALDRAERLLLPLGSIRMRSVRLDQVVLRLLRGRIDAAHAQVEALLAGPTGAADRPILLALLLECHAARRDPVGWRRTVEPARRALERSTIVHGQLHDSLSRSADRWEAAADLPNAMRARELALGQAGAASAAAVAATRALHQRGAPIPAGGWDLTQLLGKGGMGEVWAATHHAHGAGAAVKLVLAEAGRVDRVGALFEAEMKAVTRLDHPGVVRVLDHGTLGAGAHAATAGRLAAGVPWFAMERARGGGLHDRVGRADWTECRRVLRALLEALAHAHARGVVHLDVKPSNVLLDPSPDGGPERVILSDFGLAGVRAITRGRARVGTPTYMAPEQFDGDPSAFGPWTDLYALGCLAVELTTGRPPFQGDTTEHLEQAHRSATPEVAPAMPVPPGFEDWARTLLAKRPADRFALAADAAGALDRLGVARGPRPFPAPPPARRPRPSEVPAMVLLRPAPFTGRADERARAWEALAEVAAVRQPRALVVIGAPGSGRTALLEWLAEAAHEVGAAEVLRGPDAADAARIRSATRPMLALVGDDPELARALAFADCPVLVAATVELPGLPTTRIALGPLGHDETRALLAALLALDPHLAADLARRSGGRPGLAVALVRDLVDRDALEPAAGGFALAAGVVPALPEQELEAWEARIRRALLGHPPEALDALAAAALAGPVVPAAAWTRITARLGLDAARLREVRGVAVPLADGGLALPDPVAREALVTLARLDGRLADCARLVVGSDRLDRLGPEQAGEILAEAGEPGRAAPLLTEAAERRLRRGDLEGCGRLLGRAADAWLAGGVDPEGPTGLAHALVQARWAVARGSADALDRALRTSAQALAQGRRDAEAEALEIVARARHDAGDLLGARTALDRARLLWDALGAVPGGVRVRLRLAELDDDDGGAEGWYREAEDLAQDERERAEVALGLASIDLARGRHGPASVRARRAVDLLTRVGDVERLARAWSALGEIERAAGDLAAAERAASRASELTGTRA